MGKTLADVDLQVRQLIGDYQRTQFTEDQVREAINWGQNAVMRLKGFKVASRLYSLDGYPTGDMPTDLLAVKRVQLVESAFVAGSYDIVVSNETFEDGGSGPRKSVVTVNIVRHGGFGGSIDIFIPETVYRVTTKWFTDYFYIDSPSNFATGDIGTWMSGSSYTGGVDPGIILLGAPDTFQIGAWTTGAYVHQAPLASLTGNSVLPAVSSNLFSLSYRDNGGGG